MRWVTSSWCTSVQSVPASAGCYVAHPLHRQGGGSAASKLAVLEQRSAAASRLAWCPKITHSAAEHAVMAPQTGSGPAASTSPPLHPGMRGSSLGPLMGCFVRCTVRIMGRGAAADGAAILERPSLSGQAKPSRLGSKDILKELLRSHDQGKGSANDQQAISRLTRSVIGAVTSVAPCDSSTAIAVCSWDKLVKLAGYAARTSAEACHRMELPVWIVQQSATVAQAMLSTQT